MGKRQGRKKTRAWKIAKAKDEHRTLNIERPTSNEGINSKGRGHKSDGKEYGGASDDKE